MDDVVDESDDNDDIETESEIENENEDKDQLFKVSTRPNQREQIYTINIFFR